MKNLSQSSLAAFVRRHARPNTWVYTDEYSGYNWIGWYPDCGGNSGAASGHSMT